MNHRPLRSAANSPTHSAAHFRPLSHRAKLHGYFALLPAMLATLVAACGGGGGDEIDSLQTASQPKIFSLVPGAPQPAVQQTAIDELNYHMRADGPIEVMADPRLADNKDSNHTVGNAADVAPTLTTTGM